MFLGLLDQHADPSISKQKFDKNLDFFCFVTSLLLLIFENAKKSFFVGILKVTDEKRRIQIRIRIVSLRCGSENPHPDPYQNVTDPEQWL
jgi:hypothetical protein